MKANCPLACGLCTPSEEPDPVDGECKNWDEDCRTLAASGFCEDEDPEW